MAKKRSTAEWIELMAKYPSPDYWMHEIIEDAGADRRISIYEGKDLDSADIRNQKYDLDKRIWCREKEFWDAEEAALISFGRDPDKVVKRDEYVPWDEDDEDFKKHSELWDQIEKRRLLIKDAQEKEMLPDFFPPKTYVKWAERMGFFIPGFVTNELDAIQREREAIRQGKRPSIFPGIYLDPVEMSEDDSERVSEKKGRSQQKRFDNNLLKILAAVLIYAKLGNKPAELSKALADILENRALELANKRLLLGVSTIEERIEEALDLL